MTKVLENQLSKKIASWSGRFALMLGIGLLARKALGKTEGKTHKVMVGLFFGLITLRILAKEAGKQNVAKQCEGGDHGQNCSHALRTSVENAAQKIGPLAATCLTGQLGSCLRQARKVLFDK